MMPRENSGAIFFPKGEGYYSPAIGNAPTSRYKRF